MTWEHLPFDTDGPNGLYCIKKGICYLWLYGTDSDREWRFHLRGCRVKTAIGWANINYYREAMLVYAWILDNIDVDCIQIGGHSYGGALAQIVASMCRYNKRAVNVDCITFGTVRAGRLANSADNEHWIHRGDLAPLWPLWPFYSLKGKRIRFGKPGLPWIVHQPDHYREPIETLFPRGIY
jgi:pimeloyl-ACP methyl ester carboxylesterase